MTVQEFVDHAGSLSCAYCQSLELATRRKPPNHIELYCISCGRHQRYLAQSSQGTNRPKLKAGTLDEVWAEARGHCAHCGLSSEMLEILGLHRTIQHVPPFAVDGHEGYKIPLCSWCQAHSATEMKKLSSLVERLAKKFSGNGGADGQ
jgi:hypothetical protein